MKGNTNFNTTMFVFAIFLLIGLVIHSFGQINPIKPIPKLIVLDKLSPDSAQVLNGPPETVTMRSGYMVLAPSKSVGRHSTKDYEEAIVVLAGKGEMRIIRGPTLHLRTFCVAYCPPHTEHDVINTGPDTLRYVYIVDKAK